MNIYNIGIWMLEYIRTLSTYKLHVCVYVVLVTLYNLTRNINLNIVFVYQICKI